MYSRDRIKRIRVWRIEFNMVIMPDENVRASSLLEGTQGKPRGIRASDEASRKQQFAYNSLCDIT